MKIENGWKSRFRQWDKLELKVRISSLTIFEIRIDVSLRNYKLTLLNVTLKF